MALEIHTVELRAKDSMSPVFKNAGNAATQTARTISQSFQQASESTRRFSVASAAMGASIASATLVLGEWSRAAAEDAAGQDRLQQAVENTGKSYDQYADQIDQVIKKGQEKAYADDATREALVRLTTVTGDAGKAMEQMGLVMDFARARGISLADSANVIGKVMGGNVGILSRYGFALEEGATATEALALIQARSAGQAQTYADSQLGQLDKMKDRWAELTETIGGSTGELQQFLLLLPGLSAGATAIAGLLSGVGGIGNLAKLLGPAALLAGSAYLAYDANSNPYGAGSDIFAQFGSKGAGLGNTLLPGNPFSGIQDQFNGILEGNALIDAVSKLIYTTPGTITNQDPGTYAVGRLKAAGILPSNFEGNIDDAARYISGAANASGLSNSQYVARKLDVATAYTFDPISGQYVYNDTLTGLDRQRRLDAMPTVGANPNYGSMYAIAQGQLGRTSPYGPNGIYNPLTMENKSEATTYARGGSGAVANSLSGVGSAAIVRSPEMDAAAKATQIQMQTDALVAQYPAWEGVIRGINSANDAQQAYKATQDGLIDSQGVYSQQQSEYSSQLSSLTAGYEILQQRQADGVKLTAEEQALLDNYPGYYERLTGGVEDATVAQALLAAQYAENMEKGDQMNATLEGTNTVLGTLAEALSLYILSLEGVPPEVRTELILNNDPALESLYGFLNLIPDSVTIPMYVTGTDIGGFLGGGNGGYQLGGVIPGARHGRVLGGNYTLVGEDGPELLAGGRGAGGMVIPASATRAKMRGGSGGGDMIFNAPITVIANDPRSFANQMREYSVGGSRA